MPCSLPPCAQHQTPHANMSDRRTTVELQSSEVAVSCTSCLGLHTDQCWANTARTNPCLTATANYRQSRQPCLMGFNGIFRYAAAHASGGSSMQCLSGWLCLVMRVEDKPLLLRELPKLYRASDFIDFNIHRFENEPARIGLQSKLCKHMFCRTPACVSFRIREDILVLYKPCVDRCSVFHLHLQATARHCHAEEIHSGAPPKMSTMSCPADNGLKKSATCPSTPSTQGLSLSSHCK
jgi:hypothetical protein